MPGKRLSRASILLCDDVRQELGGKVSLMGLFREVGLAETPAVLPRFFAVLFLRGDEGPCHLSLELITPEGASKSLWSKEVKLRGADSELIEIIGIWNLQLSEIGSHRIRLNGAEGSVEETTLEVGKASR